ncbi:MAG: hypothetical protein R2909_02875 [Gemmatimonadales bacterium]
MALLTRIGRVYQVVAAASVLLGDAPTSAPELLYHNSAGGYSELWRAVDGGRPARVLPAGVSAFDATASADGAIAFMRPDRAGDLALWIRDPAGQVLRRLSPTGVDDRMPAFAPDGKRLAFVRSDAGAGSTLWIASLDRGETRSLVAASATILSPSWSPDGSRLAYASNQGGRFRIWMVAANGAGARPVSDPLGADLEPCFAPDGRRLVFVRQLGNGTIDLVIKDLRSGAEAVLALEGGESGPVWSPTGDRIAFASDRDGDLEIYTVRPDGSDLLKVTDNDIDDTDPAWLARPAGRR